MEGFPEGSAPNEAALLALGALADHGLVSFEQPQLQEGRFCRQIEWTDLGGGLSFVVSFSFFLGGGGGIYFLSWFSKGSRRATDRPGGGPGPKRHPGHSLVKLKLEFEAARFAVALAHVGIGRKRAQKRPMAPHICPAFHVRASA